MIIGHVIIGHVTPCAYVIFCFDDDLSLGGTGDLTVMFNDLESKFDADTKFIGVGLSMGGLILVRFLGEQINLQRRFLCAISVCQGYCSIE